MTTSNTRIDQWVRAAIRSLSPYSSARGEFSDTSRPMVLLDANENPFETGLNRYPDPQHLALKQLLSAQMGIEPNRMLLGNGSDEILDMLVRVFCEPNRDAIITLPPTFGMFKVLADINAVACIEVPLTERFQPDVPAVLKAAGPQTRILFLCSPNNPTGNLLDRDRVLELVRSFPGLVVVDEAYIQFADAPGMLPELDQFDNLVVTRTFSKAYGMAGIRLGVCFAHPSVIHYLNLIKLPYNVNELTQQKALECLQDSGRLEREVALLNAERIRLAQALPGFQLVEHVFPSQANFLLVRVDDANRRYRELLAAGIVARNRTSQAGCENAIRITVGTPEENDRLLAALKTIDETRL